MLTIRNTEAIRQIEAAIGYTFRDKRLLVQVLTRKTYLKIDPEAPDNEVLEFYGDTLMNYHVTNYFMAKYAHMLEDGLFFMRTVEQFTDLRSHYVCNRYLTERVKALGLARYLRAQNRDAELRRDGEKAYADIFESLVGAIYLDSYQNDALIRSFILRQLGIEPRRAPAEIEAFDYDSLAHEIPEDVPFPCDEPDEAMIPDEPAEEIALAAESVDETEEAPVEAMPVRETPAMTVFETATEAAAETAAEVISEPAPAEIPSADEINALAAEIPAPVAEAAPATNREKLAILCEQLGYEQPTYGETPPNAPNARPVAACTLRFRDAKGKQVKISLNDSGKTLAEATEKAAGKMLAKVAKHAAEAEVKTADKPAVKAEKPAKPAKFKAEKQTVKAEVPAAETAVAEAPVAEAPAEAPIEAAPVEITAEIPAETVTVAPAEEKTAEETPVETAAEESVPAEVMTEPPTENAPVEETPAAEAVPVEITSSDEAAPVPPEAVTEETAPAAEITVETVPVVVAPAEEIPAKPATETTTEATPPEEKATEEKPKKKAPAKKKSAPKKKTDTTAEAVTETPAEAADQPAEAPKPEKKTPARRKAPAKKKAEADAANTEAPAEAVSDAAPTEAEKKPAEAKKPRAPRKTGAKKEASAEEKTHAE